MILSHPTITAISTQGTTYSADKQDENGLWLYLNVAVQHVEDMLRTGFTKMEDMVTVPTPPAVEVVTEPTAAQESAPSTETASYFPFTSDKSDPAPEGSTGFSTAFTKETQPDPAPKPVMEPVMEPVVEPVPETVAPVEEHPADADVPHLSLS